MSDFEKLINASDLIEWIMEAFPDWCVGSVRSIVDYVEALPSAQQWIPCSERLPGYGEDVILSIGGVCSVGHCVPISCCFVGMGLEQSNGCGVDWYYDGWYHPENDVDAWMELPEPWKGEEE